MNGDGRNDVVKNTGLNTPQQVSVVVPQPPATDRVRPASRCRSSSSPYFVSVGDLNNDNRLDIVETDDGDRPLRAEPRATTALGRVIWGPATTTFPAAPRGDATTASAASR